MQGIMADVQFKSSYWQEDDGQRVMMWNLVSV